MIKWWWWVFNNKVIIIIWYNRERRSKDEVVEDEEEKEARRDTTQRGKKRLDHNIHKAVGNNISWYTMASIHGYNHVVIVNAPAQAFFEQIDFGYNKKLDGPATAIGTKRTIHWQKMCDRRTDRSRVFIIENVILLCDC